jgi:hypothetical protein
MVVAGAPVVAVFAATVDGTTEVGATVVGTTAVVDANWSSENAAGAVSGSGTTSQNTPTTVDAAIKATKP